MIKKYYGIYQAVVTNIQDPEKRGRIKVVCPEVTCEAETAWCDPVVPVAYDNGGDFCLPQKKETVWLAFIGGDANKPVWLGGWWRKNKTPLGESYTDLEDIRIISYAGCVIVMKDDTIFLNAGNETFNISVGDNKVTLQGDDITLKCAETKVVGNLSVEGNINVSGGMTVQGIITARAFNVLPDEEIAGGEI